MNQRFLLPIFAAVLAGAVLLAILVVATPGGRGEAAEEAGVAPSAAGLSRPARAAMSQWLQAANDDLARRADDYELDTPRARTETGEALPFREAVLATGTVEALRAAAPGTVVSLGLFSDVALELRVTRRLQKDGEDLLFATVEGRAENDHLAMSWQEEAARGLVELPSINRAYEILRRPSGEYVAREWLYTDKVCARVVPGTNAAEPGMPASPESIAALPAEPAGAAGIVPALNSRPSAIATIYLDFDGEVVSGTAWAGGATINALPARMNAAQIEETWRRVASHFGVFDVNVTTDRAIFDAAPANRKTHCIITPTDTARPGVGGVAYLFSFTNPSSLTKICWTFEDDVPANAALVSSHEIGHTLGLNHHGRVAEGSEPREEYYRGHGTGETGWGPFMGSPYRQNLQQWSKGEYARANNSLQDDLAIMTDPARIPYLADDHGNAPESVTALTSGVARTGIIEENTDGDYFRLEVGTGQQPVRVELPVGTMLDAKLEVYDEAQNLLGTFNPPNALAISSVVNFPTRQTIYLRVSGTGKPEVAGTGYSDYSSLGSYVLTVGNALPTKVENLTATGLSPASIRLLWEAAVAATSYRVYRDDVLIATVNALGFTDQNLREDTSYTYRVVASNNAGEAESSEPVAARTMTWLAGNPFGVRVLDPAATRTASNETYTFRGQMGEGLTNGAMWSNPLTGQAGFIPPAADWTVAIPLAGGTNRVVFSAPYQQTVGTNTLAYDNAGDPAYFGGWTNGARGGIGFGPWVFSAAATNVTHFRANTLTHTNLTVGSLNGFGLQASAGGVGTARRQLNQALEVGHSMRLNFDSNLIDTGRSVGVAWQDGATNSRLTFYAVGGQPNFRVRDAAGDRDSGIAYSTQGVVLDLRLEAAGGYRLEVGSQVLSGQLAPGSAVSGLLFSNHSAGSGLARAAYLGIMSVQNVSISNASTRVTAPAVALSDAMVQLVQGLPAAWWLEYFGTIEGADASADSDGDGLSNAQEYLLGTDPTDAASTFVVSEFERQGDTLLVTWDAVPGKTYILETRTSLSSGEWQPLEDTRVTAWSGIRRLTRSIPTGGETFFVRVALLR